MQSSWSLSVSRDCSWANVFITASKIAFLSSGAIPGKFASGNWRLWKQSKVESAWSNNFHSNRSETWGISQGTWPCKETFDKIIEPLHDPATWWWVIRNKEKSSLTLRELLCSECPSASTCNAAGQHGWFCTMWPACAKGLIYYYWKEKKMDPCSESLFLLFTMSEKD